MSKRFDFIIYLCSYGQTQDETARCIVELYLSRSYNFDTLWVSRDAIIGRSRSLACTHFLRQGNSDYMIFLDSDVTFTKQDIEKVYKSLKAGYPIVAGVCSASDGSIPGISATPITFNENKLFEMKSIGTSFMGISKQALQKIKDTLNLPLLNQGEWWECYSFFDAGYSPEDNTYMAEDWDFCRKATKAGVKIYLHSGTRLGHIKASLIKAEDAITHSGFAP